MTEPTFIPASPNGLPYLMQDGSHSSIPPVMMIHGKGGDEKSMWVLERVLPRGGPILSPRGLYPVLTGGYQWVPQESVGRPDFLDFAGSVAALAGVGDDIQDRFSLDLNRLVLMGFSQGAALAFASVVTGAFRPSAVVSLAGFIPEGNIEPLHGLPIFWGHGLRDHFVPVDVAREDVERLRGVGAEVQYCEVDVGHKLGAECARGLKQWLIDLFNLHPLDHAQS